MACGAFLACGGSVSNGASSNDTDAGGDGGGISTTPADGGASSNDTDAGGNDGSISTTPEGGGAGDAGGGGAGDGAASLDAAPPVDHGAPSSTYPAFTPDFGQIVDNGGYVMKSPVIVPITWSSDASEATYDSFVDALGNTSYWQATTSEYGVGPATSGTVNHVHMTTAAPASITDQQIQQMVTANAGASGGWPAPTQDTIYAFFLPPGVSLQVSNADACQQGVGGYHDQVMVGSTLTAYAVVPNCNFGGANTPQQQTTMSMSHELVEAATDPQPQAQNPGYVGFDTNHFAFDWFQEFQSETGDACELFQSSFYEDKETTPAPFDNWVQRTWSNKSGAAGHDPCVPLASAPYFNVTPLNLPMVNVTLPASLTGGSAQTIMTKGVHIPVGQTGTFTVGFYSDAATSGPWTLSFSYGSPVSQTKPTYLTATADMTQGVNGQKANISVTVHSLGSLNAELLVIHSTLNGQSHVMPVVIGSQ